jgi:Tol biopolymer transport system component
LLFASDRSGTIDLWSTPRTQIKRNFGTGIPIAVTDSEAIYYVQSPCTADVLTVPLTSDADALSQRARPVATRFATYNSAPDWSPSNDELVYQVGQPGTPDGIDLAFVSFRNGLEVVIHPDLLQFSRPRYMPDGKSVVVHGIGMTGVQGIYEIDKQSGKATLVLSSTGEDLANPVPRGSRMFYESDGRSVRFTQEIGAAGVTVYGSQTPNANIYSAPSPDGATVAIVDGSALLTVRIGGIAQKILSLQAPEQFHPFPGSLDWTADGRSILFTKVVGRERQVWRIPASGGEAKAIGLSVRDRALYFLRTSRDGKSLAFATGDCDLRPREVWALEHLVPTAR